MAEAPNMTAEERRLLERMREADRNADDLPPPSPEFQARMDAEAEASAELMRDSSVHDRVMDMPRDEFEAEFADVLNADAYDEDDPAPEADADASEGGA